jgi:hypothetical protein
VDPMFASSENENTQNLPMGHWFTGEVDGV